jgi:hypothetical protein
LEILTLLNGLTSQWVVGAAVLVLFGTWLGSLLAAAIWQVGRTMGLVAANRLAIATGLAAILSKTHLIDQLVRYFVWQMGNGLWIYTWFDWFSLAVINAAVFWVTLLVGRRTGLYLLLALLASCFFSWTLYFMVDASAVLVCALRFGGPVCIVAMVTRDILRARLPEKYFNQLGISPKEQKKNLHQVHH